jgi:molecular chaperone GrpE
MSDSSAPPVLENLAQSRSQALTPEAIDAVLAEFRGWLSAIAQAPAVAAPPENEPPDLHTLLAQFTALRHEVNLQTRATRTQQEQNNETLRQLSDALAALEQAHAAAEEAREGNAEERLRPLLKALIELHDAVALAGRELTRIQETVLPLLSQVVDALQTEEAPLDFPLDVPANPASSGLFGWLRPPPPPVDLASLKRSINAELQRRHEHQRERFRQAKEAVDRVRQLLASLAAGYTMSLQRVERTLRQHGLEPIIAVGQSFDPEKMEVVEAVADSGRPNGEVLSEVRRGYLWNGRVFRFAQVRVAKS